MSLAASGGLGAGGGMGGGVAMAHQTQPMPHQRAGPSGASSGGRRTGAQKMGAAAAATEADAALSNRAIRKTEAYPLISFDAYGSGAVTYVPPLAAVGDGGGTFVPLPARVGRDLALRTTEKSYKAMKRLLSKGGGEHYDRVLEESVATPGEDPEGSYVLVHSPQLILGARRVSALHPSVAARYAVRPEPASGGVAASAISPVGGGEAPVCLQNASLDGSVPSGDDYDRVSFSVDLVPGEKKPLSVLPEEAFQVLLAKAAKAVAEDMKKRYPSYEAPEEYWEYPFAAIVPGWNARDSVVEAAMEACGVSDELMTCRQALAGLVGSLILSPANQKLVGALVQSYAKNAKTLQEEEGKDANLEDFADDLYPVAMAVCVLPEGVEMVLVQMKEAGDPQQERQPFHTISVLGYFNFLLDPSDPKEDLDKKLTEGMSTLASVLNRTLSSAINDSPSLILTFGSNSDLLPAAASRLKTLSKFFSNKPLLLSADTAQITSIGAASLIASVHGRMPSVRIKDVSSTQVGIVLRHDGDDEPISDFSDDDVETVFDFERRVPAGPYQMECGAAECASVRSGTAEPMTGAKRIPEREAAAKAFSAQVVQRTERGGRWIPVGGVLRPLTVEKVDGGDGEEGDDVVAVEDATLEITLGRSGMISTRLVTDGESIVEATKTARNSKLQYYATILFCILFFGGFFVKSYIEDYVFERDTRRLLAYYRLVDRYGIHDGDIHAARYLVYKYGGRKDRLWKRLESKYDVPVPEVWEDAEDLDMNSEEKEEKEEEEEVMDMDEKEEQGEGEL